MTAAEHDAVAPLTLTSSADELTKVASHEAAAHEKRNWVRLSYDCNNRCTFCLDSLAHVGTMRSNLDIKIQIIEGRKKGAERLILSGGEPTMHPNFLDFVKLGRRAGYPKVQTVTNGRMFAYDAFLNGAAESGLDEVTFSLHGHVASLHDRLVGVPGAFEQETAGLKAAIASGNFIVNVDIVINKQNVSVLPEMLDTFIGWGVKEFDLLHIIPFGNAWGPAKDHLFYDLAGNEEPLRKAFEYSRRKDVHVWLNRFPAPYAEGFEELIQDPYKMNDEVRGRREEFETFLKDGTKLSCRQPERCKYCYLNQLCDGLDQAIEERSHEHVDVLRVQDPIVTQGALPAANTRHIVGTDLEAAKERSGGADARELHLELADYTGLSTHLDAEGCVFGEKLTRCSAMSENAIRQLLNAGGTFELLVELNRDTAAYLKALPELPERLIVAQPHYDLVTDQLENDVPLRAFCSELPRHVRTERIPPCLGGRAPVPPRQTLDGGMLAPDGRIHMSRYTERYVSDRYLTKSRRCQECVHHATCQGVHINFVRAHGYKELEPVAPEAS